MKSQSKQSQTTINVIENDGTFDFLKGKSFFIEKTEKAKTALKSLKIPPR